MLRIAAHEEKLGAITTDGRVVVPFAYDTLFEFTAGLATFQRTFESLFGFLDETGTIRIEERFSWAQPFAEGLAAVTDATGRAGWIDPAGEWAIEGTFEQTNDFVAGTATARVNGAWGLVDRQGKIVFPPAWEQVGVGDRDRIPVRARGKWGLVDREGSARVPARHAELGVAANGRVAFRRGKKWGFLDYDGQEIVAPLYASSSSFTDAGLARVQLGKKWGVIDRGGTVVVPIEHDEIGSAIEGRISFRKGRERGFYDLEGSVAFRGEWSRVSGFEGGVAIADGRVLYDRDGRVVAEIDFAAAPTAPEPSEEERLRFDASSFGPYLTAALAAIAPAGGAVEKNVRDAIGADFPDALKAYLLAVGSRPHFFMSRLEVMPRELRFQPSNRRVRIGTGDFQSSYWAEWSRRGEAHVIEIVPSEEVGVPDVTKRWGTFEAFFRRLWETQLDADEPCDPESPESHRAFAAALVRARATST